LSKLSKFVSAGEIFLDKQPELDTCHERRQLHVNTTPLTVEDRLDANKDFAN